MVRLFWLRIGKSEAFAMNMLDKRNHRRRRGLRILGAMMS